MKPIHYILVAIGGLWIVADSRILLANVVPRESFLGVLSTIIDKLPPELSRPIFILLWTILFLGWTVPLAVGVKPLLRKQKPN
jgi:hypothetical protein